MTDKQKQIKEMAQAMSDFELEDSANCDIELSRHLIAKGYRKASDVLEIADDLLHDLAMEYAERGHKDYFAVCENVHLKVIAKLIAEMRQEVEK